MSFLLFLSLFASFLFSLSVQLKACQFCSFQRTNFWVCSFSVLLFYSYFTYLYSNLCCFLSSASFAFSYLFFSSSSRCEQVIDLRFLNVGIYKCLIMPLAVSYSFICCIFISFIAKYFLISTAFFFYDPLVVLRSSVA